METVDATGRSESSAHYTSLKEGLFLFFLMIFSYADTSSRPTYNALSFDLSNHDSYSSMASPACLTKIIPEVSY